MKINRREAMIGATLLGGAAAAAGISPARAEQAELGIEMTPSANDGETVAQQWGAAVAAMKFSDLSADVVERAKWCLIDGLAVTAFGSNLHDTGLYLNRVAAKAGAREASIPGTKNRVPVDEAAGALAYLIHARDFDDNDFRGSYRPSCVALPAALAVADWKNRDGAALLSAVAVAYTLTGRLAAMAPHMQRFGFMPSAIFGGAGGAAAAAYLMRLDAERTAWAMELALSQGGGLFQYYLDQTEDKKLHIARTSRTSVEMALMAEVGFVGPHRVVEGAAGLNSYLQGRKNRMEKNPLIANIGDWEGPLHIVPKFFAASASIGPFLDSLDPVWRASGARGSDVAGFTIVREWEADGIAARKITEFSPPGTITGAQLDMAYSIALYLMTGDAGPDSFTRERLKDPAILSLADTANFRQTRPEGPFDVEVRLKDGRVISAPFTYPRGNVPKQPLMRDARLKKLERLTTARLTDRERQAFVDHVMALDAAADSRSWLAESWRMLRAG